MPDYSKAADSLDPMGATGSTPAPEGSDAEEQPESPDTEKQEGDEGEASEGTFFLPQDFPDAGSLNPGDTLSLKVLGKDKDGNVEVERCAPGKGWKSDMKKELT